jgi:hypothetical protein
VNFRNSPTRADDDIDNQKLSAIVWRDFELEKLVTLLKLRDLRMRRRPILPLFCRIRLTLRLLQSKAESESPDTAT